MLVRDDPLLVPVRPLDQPHRDRRAALLRQLPEEANRLLGRLEIRLHNDAEVGKVAQLRLHRRVRKDLLHQVAVDVLLHIDVDER